MTNNDTLEATILVLAETIERHRLEGKDVPNTAKTIQDDDPGVLARDNVQFRFDFWMDEVEDE